MHHFSTFWQGYQEANGDRSFLKTLFFNTKKCVYFLKSRFAPCSLASYLGSKMPGMEGWGRNWDAGESWKKEQGEHDQESQSAQNWGGFPGCRTYKFCNWGSLGQTRTVGLPTCFINMESSQRMHMSTQAFPYSLWDFGHVVDFYVSQLRLWNRGK